MYVTPSPVDDVVVLVVVVVVAVACVSLCTADPSAVATRPDVNGTNQPHITRSWCATIIAYTWTDSCRDFTRSRLPAPCILARNHPPTHASLSRKKNRRRKKKGFFARLFVSSVILMSCPVYDVLSSRPIKKTKSKKKKYAIPRLYKYNNNIVIPIYFSFLRPTL